MPEWSFEGRKLIPYRVVWELMKGQPWPDELIALHSCDRRKCCNPSHYRPGTIAENNADKEDRGQAGGLSHRDVRIIRFLLSCNIARKAIAALMEISISTVNAVASGQNHKRTDDGILGELQLQSQSEHSEESNRQGARQEGEIQQQQDEEEETSEQDTVQSNGSSFNGESNIA